MDLQFDGLTKEYDGKHVLNIGFGEIKDGSRTAMIGPNGAGKSTLIHLIGGLDRPTAGTIFYSENALIPYDDMTLVFQRPYLITTTVEKNIAYPLKIRGWSSEKIAKRVGELATDLGLSAFLKQKSWKLSGGEIQKVALARALSFRPKLLLLDEPTANIDPVTTGEIERMLLKINKEEGTTIVLITHHLAQAKRTCDQLIFLNQGKWVESGSCEKILKNPENELTKRFIEGELLI